ncbi:MAG: hypothetical protein K6T30_05690 [Alicyclobacillus sp.]|nr:hypothetical protein [Alicyclobacillus sp.]
MYSIQRRLKSLLGLWQPRHSSSLAGALYILFPLFVRSLGGSEVTIGLYAGIGAAAAVAVRWPMGFLLDRLGRKRIMLAATSLHAAASLGRTSFQPVEVFPVDDDL